MSTINLQIRETEIDAPLPEWARIGCKWTLGSELVPGDVIYLSSIANPRHLVDLITPGLWRSTVDASINGYTKMIPNQMVEIEAEKWYVVKRGGV